MMGCFKNHIFIYGLFNDALNSPVYRANCVEWWRVNVFGKLEEGRFHGMIFRAISEFAE
jgi:hypothetical protein